MQRVFFTFLPDSNFFTNASFSAFSNAIKSSVAFPLPILLGTNESTPQWQMLRNLHLYPLRAGRQPETWRTTNGCWGRRRWLAQQDLQKCPKRTSPLFGGVKKIATCANCAHASSGRVSWNASQNGPQTRGEHASCWGAGGGGVSAIQFPAVQNGCGNTIYLIRRRAGGEGPETLAGVDSYLATQFKR